MQQLFPSSTVDFLKTDSSQPYLEAVQTKRPLIHCITNSVVENFTANMLLAIGASPAMVTAEEEVANFVNIADGLLINIGTVTATTAKSMLLAAKTANIAKKPWVLDPVAVGAALPFRTNLAKQLLTLQPTVIRCNASEILILDQKPSNGKGTDSQDSLASAILSADAVAKAFNSCVVVTGEIDYITDGTTRFYVTGGTPALTRVTGTGCGLSALVAAFIASHQNHLSAAATACALMAKASENSLTDRGLGTFAVSLIDNLSQPLFN
ncbi:hydroxyethylthiazole kinase [Orbaceae bacterium ESL0721]|nr:hydroxyethylthiazole kinase [Orbaceae bacterium ESL0721]